MPPIQGIGAFTADEFRAVGGDQLAEDIERLFTQSFAGERGQAELTSDEELSSALHQRNFNRAGAVVFGKVVYSMPYLHWYRVNLDDMMGDMPCCFGAETSLTPLSTKSTAPLSPDTGVIVWVPPEGIYGVIICVVPEITQNGGLVHPDFVSQGGNTGFKRETYFRDLLTMMSEGAGAIDFSAGRPLDSTAIGEWGRAGLLGNMLHLGPLLTFLRLDESCGLTLNYYDRLARLAAHAFDLRTAVSETTVRDDSGESLHHTGYSPYAWEALGAFQSDMQVVREELDARAVQYQQPRSTVEPLADDQMPFYRLEEFKGYLGQGGMRHLAAPPANPQQPETLSNQASRPGLFREQLGLHGAWAVSSAHSIAIVKRPLNTIPKRIKLSEDRGGDVFEEGAGYKFAGVNGDGGDHKVSDVAASDELPHLQRTMGLSDFLAHAFEWTGLHPFHYHTKDFHTPEQQEAAAGDGVTKIQEPLNFASLLGSQWLQAPEAKNVAIDHRYGEVQYFERSAGLFILPDGSTVLRGGGGEEMRMVGGSVVLDAPGDIFIKPGRNVNIWAGDDLILKANQSIDITSSNRDVRLKAENNMQMLAGNSGSGGILLESRATGNTYDFDRKTGEDVGTSGIVLRAPNSDLVSWAGNIYLRTGGQNLFDGDIVLDAAKGQRAIRTVSRDFIRHIGNLAADTFPVEGSKTVANFYSASNAQIQTGIQFNGFVTSTGGLLCQGHVSIIDGHIGSTDAKQFNGLVGTIEKQNLAQSRQSLLKLRQDMRKFRESMEQDYQSAFTEFWYEDERAGNDELIEIAEFGLRNESQMRTQDFSVMEAYWQQMAAAQQSQLSTWEEPTVSYQNNDMTPFPGTDKWSTEATWLQQTLQLHDPATGLDKPRAEGLYEEPQFGEVTKAILEGNYLVTSS